MRTRYMRGWLAAAVVSMAACSTMTHPGAAVGDDDDDGGGGGGGGGGGSGGDGGGAVVGGWHAMPLVDDPAGDRVVHHRGSDRVTGIVFASADRGWVVTQGANPGEDSGGAVFHASATGITSVAFSGDGTGIRLLGSIQFTGLQPTPAGYVAMAYASDVVQSTDGGRTFTIDTNGPPDSAGIERALGYQVTDAGTTMVLDSGKVSTLDRAPGHAALLTDVWAPNASPSIPAELDARWCQDGPFAAAQPTTRYNVHVSADRRFIAYTSNRDQVPKICVSTDGGASFFPRVLDVDDRFTNFVPSGVMFPSPQVGLTWFAEPSAGAYLQRSTDGGATWHAVALPAALAGAALELPVGFFAPDGQHGWLAGYDTSGPGRAVLIATRDAGATWATVDGVGDAVEAFHGGKLYAGFALDATHLWLGGEQGLVMHN